MRRGLSTSEIENMPVTEYWNLYIFDTFLEPQGPLYNDTVFAQQQLTSFATCPNMSRKGLDSLKLKDFTMMKHGDDFVFLSEEQRKAKEYEEDKAKMERMLSSYSNEDVKAKVRDRLQKELDNKYGKI